MKIDAAELFDDEEAMSMLEVLLDAVNEIADDNIDYGSDDPFYTIQNNEEAILMIKVSMKAILTRYFAGKEFEYDGEPVEPIDRKLRLVK